MDKDLVFLRNCTKDELTVLVKIMEKKISANITTEVKEDPVNHVEKIVEEFSLFGGNTLANTMRGFKGVSYKEILNDVSKGIGVCDHDSDIDSAESSLLKWYFEKIWSSASEENKKKLIEEMGYYGDINNFTVDDLLLYEGSTPTESMLYGFATVVADLISSKFCGKCIRRGVVLSDPYTPYFLFILDPVVANPVVAIIQTIMLTNPAKDVIIPGCIYIAALRKIKLAEM